jgi:GR25 family glycosyltransferase involved in LPS biosynthesis
LAIGAIPATGAKYTGAETDSHWGSQVNLRETSSRLRGIAFRTWRAVLGLIPGGRISTFGAGEGKIGMILIVNLNRQPQRLRRTLRELRRFKTADGHSLASLARRLVAVDASDGREVAATADVDQTYRLGDQLYVQPDARLEECFGVDEPIRMTRQEVAIARSHIEAWKFVSAGPCSHVLVLEDDVWFSSGAAAMIVRGWNAAVARTADTNGPHLLYLSYADAGGTATRTEICDALFQPQRGLWFLSGYVLSRDGAEKLLQAMPVVGPVDLWMNYRFDELGTFALSSPAILQRPDGGSDNSYSILPYLARAGIVDANAIEVPDRNAAGPVLAWTPAGKREGLAMALSMLGLRVRVFDDDDEVMSEDDLAIQLETFDALVDAPLSTDAMAAAIASKNTKFVLEEAARRCIETDILPTSRTVVLRLDEPRDDLWQPLCSLLNLAPPVQAFPIGPPREWRVFRCDPAPPLRDAGITAPHISSMDETAWALLPTNSWPSQPLSHERMPLPNGCLLHTPLTAVALKFPQRIETFPGNLAAFVQEGLAYDADGAKLTCSRAEMGARHYKSGAFASAQTFGHGRFEAEIKSARGSGLITGFFLHRDSPRQEIDIEIAGDDPHRMLVNVYFNPGDDGAAMAYGYRGSPCYVELGFDATLDFHLYTIDWHPDSISWSVDGRIVHQRVSWDPTPIPHLPMRLHANLWAPRSEELAGRIDESALPSSATFRNASIWT